MMTQRNNEGFDVGFIILFAFIAVSILAVYTGYTEHTNLKRKRAELIENCLHDGKKLYECLALLKGVAQ